MTKPPFPAQIDNTMRSAWRACQRELNWSFIEEWSYPVPSVHLHAGGAFASGMETARVSYFMHGEPPDVAVGKGWVKLIEEYGDFQPPHNSKKTAHRMGEAFIDYFREYPLDSDPIRPLMLRNGKPAVEFRFAIPLPIQHPETGDPILYCGRFDMLAKVNDQLMVVDEKTTQSLGEYFAARYALSSQFTGYCWAAKSFGYPVTGAIVRGIGIYAESFRHVQLPFQRPDFIIEEWYQQLLRDVNAMIAAWKSGVFEADHASSCGRYGGCEYLSVCQIAPESRQNYLEVNFVKRHWDPLYSGQEVE